MHKGANINETSVTIIPFNIAASLFQSLISQL